MHVKFAETEMTELPEQSLRMKRLVNTTAHGPDLSVSWVEIWGNHRKMRTDRSTRVYYLLSGSATFQVGDGEPFEVAAGDAVVISRGTPYELTGNLTYLVINGPGYVKGDDIDVL
jgi:mannose-6-phosphate isomerase-like protein (cupin superfamily)